MTGIGGAVDAVTWQALGLVLTLLGLGLSAVVWARRGPARGLRAVAWSLLPLAAGLTGVLRLAWEIADAVVRWAARLVFSPVVWAGLLVTAVAVALFAGSGWLLRRASPAPAGGEATPPVPGRRSPALPPAGPTAGPTARPGAPDDMAEVEEILRRHGIQ